MALVPISCAWRQGDCVLEGPSRAHVRRRWGTRALAPATARWARLQGLLKCLYRFLLLQQRLLSIPANKVYAENVHIFCIVWRRHELCTRACAAVSPARQASLAKLQQT